MLSKNNLNISNGVKIIFDLDYTLLDTTRFKERLAEIFFGEDFQADYKKYFSNQNINFDSEKYLTILKAEGRTDGRREKELRLSLEELMSQMDNYLFTDVVEVLKRLKDNGHELILITFGDKKWQEKKVKSLSASRYFDKIIFEEKNKADSEYLKLLKTAEEIIIVNDNARETKEIVKIIGEKAKIFLVDGPYVKNIEHNWPIHKLAELIA